MILYQLRCNDEHTFEAWFRDSQAFDDQARTGHVECPYCGTTQVAKAPEVSEAPYVASKPKPESLSEADINAASNTRAHEVAQQILDAVSQVKECAEERGIYGRASQEEGSELEEDGSDVVRLPGTSRRND